MYPWKSLFPQATMAHWVALIRFCSPQPNTTLLCKTKNTGLVHRVVSQFTLQLLPVLIIPTCGRMARLSLHWNVCIVLHSINKFTFNSNVYSVLFK